MHLLKLPPHPFASLFITALSKYILWARCTQCYEYSTLRISIQHIRICPATSMYNPWICIFLNTREPVKLKKKKKRKEKKISLGLSLFLGLLSGGRVGSFSSCYLVHLQEKMALLSLLGGPLPSHPSATWIISNAIFRLMNCFLLQRSTKQRNERLGFPPSP